LTQNACSDIIVGRVYKMEYDDIMKALSRPKSRLAGLKQVLRAMESGKAAAVVLADDADDHIRRRVRSRCEALGVPCHEGPVMSELGSQCRLDVGTAVACILKDG
jgi:large subunit ribosomal protein L7A